MPTDRKGALTALLERLTPDQRLATEHLNGSAVVAAAAGGGKTRVLSLRIWSLIDLHGVDPTRVGACAFSRDAAKEISTRLEGYGLPKTLRVGTVHSIAYEILRSSPTSYGGLYNVDEKGELYRTLQDILSREIKDDDLNPDRMERIIGLVKAEGYPAAGPGAQQAEPALERFLYGLTKSHSLAQVALKAYRLYETARVQKRLMSYDDMLLGAAIALDHEPTVRELWVKRFDHVLADEAQDLSAVQWRILKVLAEEAQSFMAIGDLAQSIYAFRGANPKTFLEFSTTSKSIYKISKNFRSATSICRAASMVIAGKSWNLSGALVPRDDAPAGEIHFETFPDSDRESTAVVEKIQSLLAAGVPAQEMAILYRLTVLLNGVETALLSAQVPYLVRSGQIFYDRKEVKDLLAYLVVATCRDPDGKAARRVANVPFRYLGRVFLDAVEQRAARKGVAFLDALETSSPPKIYHRRSVREFMSIIKAANHLVAEGRNAADVLRLVVDQTGYVKWLTKHQGEGDGGENAARVTSVHELIRIAEHFETADVLLDYVDQFRKAAPGARKKAAKVAAVTLSTIHSFKGLERSHVFLIGASEGVMPLWNSEDVDEERRLFYVAVTRAKEYLWISGPSRTATETGLRSLNASRFVGEAGIFESEDEGSSFHSRCSSPASLQSGSSVNGHDSDVRTR